MMPNDILRVKICSFLLQKINDEATTDAIYQYLQKEKNSPPLKRVASTVVTTKCIEKAAPSTWRLDRTEYKRYLTSLRYMKSTNEMIKIIKHDLEELDEGF